MREEGANFEKKEREFIKENKHNINFSLWIKIYLLVFSFVKVYV